MQSDEALNLKQLEFWPNTFFPPVSIFKDSMPARSALHLFRARGRVIGKGIHFPDIGIKNGINFRKSLV